MRKTGGNIEYEVFLLLKDEIESKIKGTVYLRGTRPLNAKTEDAIISFMTGIDAQMQTGALNVNIYVPDINIGQTDLVKDVARCNEIEAFMQNLIEQSAVSSNYKFSLGNTINTFAEDDINQHFINVKLKYKLLTI